MAVLVLVIAMLVVVVNVLMMVMIVMVMTVITVTMRQMIVIGVACLRVAMAAAGIGAAFGIERRLDLDHARSQSLHHCLDDMVASDAQAFTDDLRRQMPVAEVPGDPDQMMRIAAANFEERLRCRHHLDQPVIVEHQGVAATQRDRVFEIKQELKSPRAGHRHPPPVPVVEIEHDGIGRRFAPAMLRADLGRADHARILTAFRPCRR